MKVGAHTLESLIRQLRQNPANLYKFACENWKVKTKEYVEQVTRIGKNQVDELFADYKKDFKKIADGVSAGAKLGTGYAFLGGVADGRSNAMQARQKRKETLNNIDISDFASELKQNQPRLEKRVRVFIEDASFFATQFANALNNSYNKKLENQQNAKDNRYLLDNKFINPLLPITLQSQRLTGDPRALALMTAVVDTVIAEAHKIPLGILHAAAKNAVEYIYETLDDTSKNQSLNKVKAQESTEHISSKANGQRNDLSEIKLVLTESESSLGSLTPPATPKNINSGRSKAR